MSVNLAATRAGIAALLQACAGISSVVAYDRADVGTNTLPCAGITLTRITQPDYDQGGPGQLNGFVFEAEWHINIRLNKAQGPAPEVAAQQLFETLFTQVRAQFDGDQLIDPNGPGVVDVSTITTGEPLIPPAGTDLPFIAALVLRTRVIA